MATLPLGQLPLDVQALVKKRQILRDQKDFAAADQIRQELSAHGYQLQDQPDGTPLLTPTHIPKPTPNATPTLSLYGSGETSSVGRKIHDQALKLLGKTSVNIALITTPAGFQPNVATVYGEISHFFKASLANYHPEIKIIFANTQADANDPKLIEPVYQADYIFTGPGSPTYAVKNLKDTLLLAAITSQARTGAASLGLASAATIAFSEFALPVYEIYKVGEPLHWQPGLNVFGQLYRPLTIIPHFNNSEGGSKTDTSHCYLGAKRFHALQTLLPPHHEVWGIDELTGVIINPSTAATQTLGKGQLHYLTP